MRDDGLTSTWSVSDDADDHAANRVLLDLAQVCHDACVRHFDEDIGYRIVNRRLWGALEGSTTEIQRGSFRAAVSVQRFVRREGHATGGEFRVVATAAHRPAALACREAPRAALWMTMAGAAGTTGVGVVGLQIAGLLSTWGQIMMMLPLLMLWRMTMALRIADDLRRDARQLALSTTERITPGMADDLDRWRRTLEVVAAQREAVAEAFCGPGFRTPGAIPGTVAAIGAGTIAPPLPRRPVAVPDLAMPPLGRTTAM